MNCIILLELKEISVVKCCIQSTSVGKCSLWPAGIELNQKILQVLSPTQVMSVELQARQGSSTGFQNSWDSTEVHWFGSDRERSKTANMVDCPARKIQTVGGPNRE